MAYTRPAYLNTPTTVPDMHNLKETHCRTACKTLHLITAKHKFISRLRRSLQKTQPSAYGFKNRSREDRIDAVNESSRVCSNVDATFGQSRISLTVS